MAKDASGMGEIKDPDEQWEELMESAEEYFRRDGDPECSTEHFSFIFDSIKQDNIPVLKGDIENFQKKLQKIIKDSKRLMTKFAGIKTADQG